MSLKKKIIKILKGVLLNLLRKKENDIIRVLQPFAFCTRISSGIEFEEVS